MLLKFFFFFVLAQSASANSAIGCYKSALQLKDNFGANIVYRDALHLCAGSSDLKPVECYKAAIEMKDANGNQLSAKDAIYLCSKKFQLVSP
jgi:hypothetical protein